MAGANQTIRIDVISRYTGRGVKQAQRDLTNLGASASMAATKATGGMAVLGRVSQAAGTALLVGVGAALAIGAKAAIDFESSFAGVRKTVDASEPEFQRLARAIRDLSLDIPIKIDDLNKIAELGGQLGIGAAGLTDFTEVIAKLGVTTNLEIEEAATQLARFANVMGTSQSDFDRLGSSVVDLGNNFATTEKEILTFATRLSGIGSTIGASEADVLGLATAFTSLGEPAERGATAVQRTFISMLQAIEGGGPKLALFAEVIGVTADEFQNMFAQDPVGAFIAFERGLGKIIDTGGAVTEIIGELGLGSQRSINLILKGATSWEVLEEAVALANEAYEANTALDIEAEKRFETTASQLTLLANAFKDVSITIGEVTTGPIKAIIEFMRGFIDVVGGSTLALQFFGVAALAILSGRILLKLGTAVAALGLKFAATAGMAGALGTGMGRFAIGLSAMTGLLAGVAIVIGAIGLAMASARSRTLKMNAAVEQLVETLSDPSSGPEQAKADFVESLRLATTAAPGGGLDLFRISIFGEDLDEVSGILLDSGTTIGLWAEAALKGASSFDKLSGSVRESLQAKIDRLAAKGDVGGKELGGAIRELAIIDELVAKTRQVMDLERERTRQKQREFALESPQALQQQLDEIDALKDLNAFQGLDISQLVPEIALVDILSEKLGPEEAQKLYDSIMGDIEDFGGDFADAWADIIGNFADQLIDWGAIWGGYEQVVAPSVADIRTSMEEWRKDSRLLLDTMTVIFGEMDFAHRMFWLSLPDEIQRGLAAIRAESPEEFNAIFEDMFTEGLEGNLDVLEAQLITIGTFVTNWINQNWEPAMAQAMKDAGEGGLIEGTKEWDLFMEQIMNNLLIAIEEFDPLLAGTLKDLYDAGLGAVLDDPPKFDAIMDILMADLSRTQIILDLYAIGLSWADALALGFASFNLPAATGEETARAMEAIRLAGERGLEFKSPSKLSMEWGRQLGAGFNLGIQEGFAPTAGLLDSVFQQMAPSQTSNVVTTTNLTINHPNHPTDDLKKDLQRASVLAGHQRLAEVGTINNT